MRRSGRIVFLDIDGVLNTPGYLDRTMDALGYGDVNNYDLWAASLDRRAVLQLNVLARVTGARFVVSSSWRHAHPVSRLRRLLRLRGFIGKVIGVTPTLSGGRRGSECVAWLASTTYPVESFVAFDDHDERVGGYAPIQDRLVRVRRRYGSGLRDYHVALAAQVLDVDMTKEIAAWRAKAKKLTAAVRPYTPPRAVPSLEEGERLAYAAYGEKPLP